jgi:hypothetical protein
MPLAQCRDGITASAVLRSQSYSFPNGDTAPMKDLLLDILTGAVLLVVLAAIVILAAALTA